jgi:hypothetical protein
MSISESEEEIPNSNKSELAEIWRNEGSPYHSRKLLIKM